MSDPFGIGIWLEGADGRQVPIKGSCSLGRAPTSEILLPDEEVSRRHALLHVQEQHECWLVDLGSSNGTFVNGQRLFQAVKLRDEDRIEIGPFRFVFHQPLVAPEPRAGADTTVTALRESAASYCWLLVADIQASTRLCRELSPSDLPKVTGRWFARCKRVVDECGGRINQFLGDGFLAAWPEREKILRDVVDSLSGLKKIQEDARPNFRIVLHYGQVSRGGMPAMGEESLLGQEVSFTFRMERLASTLGLRSLLSEKARAQISAYLPTREVGRHPLQGFEGEFLFYTF